MGEYYIQAVLHPRQTNRFAWIHGKYILEEPSGEAHVLGICRTQHIWIR